MLFKSKNMTFNFYVKAENLQIQGKENANQLRVELVNLARSKKPKWQRRTRYEEQNEQDGVESGFPLQRWWRSWRKQHSDL